MSNHHPGRDASWTTAALRVLLAGALLVGGMSACSTSGSARLHHRAPGGAGADAASAGADSGATSMRFVNLLPGGSVPARITVGDGAKQRTLVDSVRAGAVTGWVHVPTNESGYIAVGHEAIATLGYPEQAGDRETVVFGRNDGNYTTTEFEERGARVVGQSGDIGSHQLQAPAGQDLVIGLGHGLGVPSPDGVAYDVRLGVAGRGCASGPTSDGGGTVGQDFPYGVALGEVGLVWTVRDGCRVPDSGAARVTLRPGETVYAMTWFSDRVHLRLLALPVTASGPGARGLVDSGDGPVFDFGTETYTDGGGS